MVVEGESGRNELLRGPFALFGVRNSAKLVRNLAKHRRTPMSPPQLIPPTSPGQVIAWDGRLRRRFSRHLTWSVPAADCLQSQRGKEPLSLPLHQPISNTYGITERPRVPQIISSPKSQFTTTLPQDERLITLHHHPVCRPSWRRPHLLN